MTKSVVFVSAVRTAVGDFGGGLKDLTPAELGAIVIKEALKRADVAPEKVEHVVMGQVIPNGPKDAYLSRVSAINSGVPVEVPALTLNRLCGSGVEAIISAARMIQLGDITVAVAGGAESMSRSGYYLQNMRWGMKMGDETAIDTLVGTLNDPFGNGHMGLTAEKIAGQYQISRDVQDEFSVQSHQKAVKAIEEGRFKSQIVPVEIQTRKGTVVFEKDEHPRADVSKEKLASLKAAFKKDGLVTAGNASSINDGASALVLMEEEEAKKAGKKILGRIVAYAHSGVDPTVMGLGPIPAVKKVMEKAGLKVADMDVIESNEAFAAQACAVAQELNFPAEKTNINGGAVALGHPVGATGAIITTKTLYELERTGGRYGLVTLCIGGGQGIALIVERPAA